MEWYCSTGITSISLKTILRGICKGISERNVQIYCKNVGRPKKSTAFLALCLHTLTALCTCASCTVSSVSLFIDHFNTSWMMWSLSHGPCSLSQDLFPDIHFRLSGPKSPGQFHFVFQLQPKTNSKSRPDHGLPETVKRASHFATATPLIPNVPWKFSV